MNAWYYENPRGAGMVTYASLPDPLPAFSDDDPHCQLCGEAINWESTLDAAGEFTLPDKSGSVVAHGQCGLDHGLEVA